MKLKKATINISKPGGREDSASGFLLCTELSRLLKVIEKVPNTWYNYK